MRVRVLVAVGIVACGAAAGCGDPAGPEAAPSAAEAPPEGTPTGTVGVVEAKVPVAEGEPPADLSGLLGVMGEADAPMGLGMRGEGVQNGGPKYPGIGEIGTKGPLGQGTYGSGLGGGNAGRRGTSPAGHVFDPTNHVTLVYGAPEARGIEGAEVLAVLRRGAAQARFCYARAWGGDPGIGARTLVAYGRLGEGGLEASAVVPADFPVPEVLACLRKRFATWEWPKNADGATFAVSLVFGIT